MRVEDVTDYFKLRRFTANPAEIVRFRTRHHAGDRLCVQFLHAPPVDIRGGCADFHMFHRIFLRDEYRLNGLSDLSCVMDLGANVGMFSTRAAMIARRVIAFEPFPANFESLRKNVANRPNVEAVCEAIAGEPGSLRLFRPRFAEMTGAVSSFSDTGLLDTTEYDEVPATTLDAAFERFNVASCDLMKVDIEGQEYEVLHAASEETLSRIQRIYGEYHDVRPEDPRTRIEAFTKFLKSRGFNADVIPHRKKSNHGMFYAVRAGA